MLSIFTSFTNPEERMDPWKESLNCYEHFADEVVTVGENWEKEFSFELIGKTFQEGFEKSSGDWVIKCDIDTIFHENNLQDLKKYLKKYNDYPAICAPKYQIFTPDRFHLKSNMTFILNKKKFPNIKLDGGGDLCDPTLNGVLLNEYNCPRIPVQFWNYDSVFKTKEVIAEDRARFARAWFRKFGSYGDRGGPTKNEAFQSWFNMITTRYKKHIYKLKIQDHPIFIQERLNMINDKQFGYNAFGLKDELNRTFKDYYSSLNDRYIGSVIRKVKYEKYNSTDSNL